MTLPVGVTTCAVTAGKATSFAGTDAAISVTVTPKFGGTQRIIWAATGAVIPNFTETYTSGGTGVVTFSLPHVDQIGFVDGSGSAVSMWSYDCQVTETLNGQTVRYTQTVQPLVGTSTLDLDTLPDGSVFAPTALSAFVPVVAHGTDPNYARPAGALVVIWYGTATPANKQPQDFWTDAT